MNNKIPITPFEILRRAKDMPKLLEWSKRKCLIVSGPEFWGTHYICIDNFLKHVVFCLKADLTTHVFIGDSIRAKEWRKYNENFKLLFSKKLSSSSLEWKIYKDIVLYKGRILPPKNKAKEPYWGKVVAIKIFDGNIDDQWIISRVKNLYKKPKQNPRK